MPAQILDGPELQGIVLRQIHLQALMQIRVGAILHLPVEIGRQEKDALFRMRRVVLRFEEQQRAREHEVMLAFEMQGKRFRGALLRGPHVLPLQKVRRTQLRSDRREQTHRRRRAPVRHRHSRPRRRTRRLRRIGFVARLGSQAHRSGASHQRARRRRRRGAVGLSKTHLRAIAVRQDMGTARRRRCSRQSVEEPCLRIRGGARRIRRHPASDIRVGLGSRLRVLDGGLRHSRRHGIGPASFLPDHGLARSSRSRRRARRRWRRVASRT